MFCKYHPGGSGGPSRSQSYQIKVTKKFYISGPLGIPKTCEKLLKIAVHYAESDYILSDVNFLQLKYQFYNFVHKMEIRNFVNTK
jgi:hypothetical protein